MGNLKRVRAGEYIYRGDYAIIREDVPSVGEWDVPDNTTTWFVVPASQIETAGLPEAMHDASTRRECIEWIDKEIVRTNREEN